MRIDLQTMLKATGKTSAIAASLLLGACASQTASLSPAPTTTAALSQPAQTVSQLPPPTGSGYRLSADELSLDCNKLTGRMAVRIVQIRDFQTRNQASLAARSIQTAWMPANGGRGVGSDPEGRYARDRAKLEAYNQRLAEKNCPNFDLTAELDPNAKDPPRTRRLNKS